MIKSMKIAFNSMDKIEETFNDTIIVYNTYPPVLYGNLKTLCEDLDVSYHTYKAKDFPFKIGEVEVFKIPVKRGQRKIKQKE